MEIVLAEIITGGTISERPSSGLVGRRLLVLIAGQVCRLVDELARTRIIVARLGWSVLASLPGHVVEIPGATGMQTTVCDLCRSGTGQG